MIHPSFSSRAVTAVGLFMISELLTVCDGDVCGQSPLLRDLTDLIKVRKRATVGSSIGEPGYWPWMAAVGTHEGDKNITWFCGGTLINNQYVLSAAHCFTIRNPTVIRLGEYDLASDTEGAEPEDFGISSVRLHPGYQRPVSYNDLALVKLDHPASFNFFIQPVCLPYPADFSTFEGYGATLTGWGQTSFSGVTSSVLQHVSVVVIPNSRCNQNYQSLSSNKFTLPQGVIRKQLCAGYEFGGNDACQGDSGGPLVIYDFNQKKHTLLGVISSGRGCGSRSFPGLYTRVTEYLKWIIHHVKDLPAVAIKTDEPGRPTNIVEANSIFFSFVCGRRLPLHPGDILGITSGRLRQDLSVSAESGKTAGSGNPQVMSRRKRVVGGQNTLPAAWPWMAAVGETKTGADIIWMCGGALLNDLYVLSAASCFRALDSGQIQYIVRLGDRDLESVADGASYEDFKVINVLIHPEYQHHTWYYNLAILKLDRRVEFSRFIIPICLPINDEEYFAGQNATVTGWGSNVYGGLYSTTLQEATVTVLSEDDCRLVFASLPARLKQNVIPGGFIPSMLCAQGPNGKMDICQGDMGSPLVHYNTFTNEYILLAIASSTIGCGAASIPGIYTRVEAFLQWIHINSIGEELYIDGQDELSSFPLGGGAGAFGGGSSGLGGGSSGLGGASYGAPSSGLFPNAEEVTIPTDITSGFFRPQRPSSGPFRPSDIFPLPVSTTPSPLKPAAAAVVCGSGITYSSEDNQQWKNSQAGDFPWMVAIGEQQDDGTYEFFCGGTLITETIVISAGHCFYRRTGSIVWAGRINVTAGAEVTPFDIYDVETVVVHPRFQLPSLYNDIALLKLRFPIVSSLFVHPVCFPFRGSDATLTSVGSTGTDPAVVSGWDKQGDSGLQSLQHKQVELLPDEECSRLLSSRGGRSFSTFYSQGVTNSVVCARSGQICPGNNGGAVVTFNAARSTWTLVAVTSGWVNCDSGLPGLYTNVSDYTDWVWDIINSLNSVPVFQENYSDYDYINA